jgi:hypothetical protein
VGPQEPHSLGELLKLRMNVPYESHERPGTAVCRNERTAVRATEWILRMIADRPSEKSSVHVYREWYVSRLPSHPSKNREIRLTEQIWVTKPVSTHKLKQMSTEQHLLDSLIASTRCRCKIKGTESCPALRCVSVCPKPAICRMAGTWNPRSLRSSCRIKLYVGTFAPKD